MDLSMKMNMTGRRLVKNATFPNSFFVFLLCIGFCLGFLGTRYYKLHKTHFSKHIYSTAEIIRTRALTHNLHLLEYSNSHLEQQIADMHSRETLLRQNPARLREARITDLLGLNQQVGPGVEVVVQDNPKPVLLGEDPNSGIVHNYDLAQIVNELRAAGATAIAINHHRIQTLTGIFLFRSGDYD